VVNVPPVWFLALFGVLLAAWVSYWLVNRPERNEEWEAGERALDFGAREGMTFRLSYEGLAEFLYELREKFENGWSRSQVAALLNNVERHVKRFPGHNF
jgi:peptidoglycan/LPS O-acetylase OafA/YrhL